MALYTEQSNAHLILTSECTVSFSAISKNKYTDLGKCGTTEIHLSTAQKFLSEVTVLSARNVGHNVCVTKLHAIDWCKHL